MLGIGKIIALVIFVPTFAIFFAVTSIPSEAFIGLLIVGCLLMVFPSALNKTRVGEVASVLLGFLTITITCYVIYLVADPLQGGPISDWTLLTYIIAYLDFDLWPIQALKITISVLWGIILGIVLYIGFVLSQRGSVIFRA